MNENENGTFEISRILNPAMPPAKLEEFLEINGRSAYYNLTLTKADITGLAEERNAALSAASRLEFGYDTLECIINEFYKSPYVNQFEYTEIINEIQNLFYALKNETGEVFADEELIKLMAELFDGFCNGSLELLKGLGVQHIIGHAKQKAEAEREDSEESEVQAGGYEPVSTGGGLGVAAHAVQRQFTQEERIALAESLAVMLNELSVRYTKGQSFSIKSETAQGIVNSIMYAAELSGEAYESDKLRTAYEKGLAVIDELHESAKRLYKMVIGTRTDTPLKTYNTALDAEIPAFLKNYDKTYHAADVPRLSYFPVFDDSRLQGVSYIENYLGCLLVENEICALFDSDDLTRLLSASAGKEWFPNIASLALTNAIYSVLIGKPPTNVILTAAHKPLIERELKSIAKSGISIYTVIGDAAESIAAGCESGAHGYIARFAEERFLPVLTDAHSHGRVLSPLYMNGNADYS